MKKDILCELNVINFSKVRCAFNRTSQIALYRDESSFMNCIIISLRWRQSKRDSKKNAGELQKYIKIYDTTKCILDIEINILKRQYP